MTTNNVSSDLHSSSVISRARMCDMEVCTNSRCISNIIDPNDEQKHSTNVLEKIHLLPVNKEAPRENVTGALLELMKTKTVVRQYMRIEVKVDTSVDSINREPVGDISDASGSPYVVTYIIVECQPSLGYVDSSTIIYTQGNPLQPLKRIQILALVHPNSSFAKTSGVLPQMQLYYSAIPSPGDDDSATESPMVSASSNETHTSTILESNTSNSSSLERYSMLGRSSPRLLRRPEDILTLILDDSSDIASEESDLDNHHAPAFRLSNNNDTNNQAESSNRMVQLNFRFSPHSSNRDASTNVTFRTNKSEDSKMGSTVPILSESTLFHEYIAPYLRSKQSVAPVSSQKDTGAEKSPTASEIGGAVVLYPGRKLVIRDISFVVWATDPNNGPGYLDQDTLIYVSLDPWGEYRRVHIIPFADTLPTTYSYDLFEDYIRPYLLENPWKLFHKGDIFSFRGVEFKVIATEPPSIPAARVGPETVVHFEGSINPSILDILPTDLLARVRRLPARLQPFAIIAAAQSLDPQLLMRILPNGAIRNSSRGMEESMVDLIKQKWVRPFNFESYFKAYPELCSAKQVAEGKTATLLDAEIYDERIKEVRKNHSGPSTFGKAVEFLFFNPQLENFNLKNNIKDFDPPCCTVCTLQLSDGDESITFPCGHPFHWKCVYSWLRCSSTCPNCRSNICEVVSNDGASSTNMIDHDENQGAIAYLRQLVGDFFS